MIEFVRYIKKQMPPTDLEEAVAMSQAGTTEGTCWVLIRYDKAVAAKMIACIISRKTSRYLEFKTMDTLELMNRQLKEKEPTKTIRR